MRDRLPSLIAITITIVWVASITLDAVAPHYDPPPTIHALMMLVAGWAFSRGLLRNGRD